MDWTLVRRLNSAKILRVILCIPVFCTDLHELVMSMNTFIYAKDISAAPRLRVTRSAHEIHFYK